MALVLASLAACSGGDDSVAVTSPPVVTPPVLTLPTCTTAVAADAPLHNISAIQGTDNTSPLASQSVTARGVVVGDFQNTTVGTATTTRLNGLFVQHAMPDADPLTSEGVFVFAPANATRVKVGDFVQVAGVVSEFGQTAGATAAPDSITQIAGTTAAPVAISVCGCGLTQAPTPVTLPWPTRPRWSVMKACWSSLHSRWP